MRVIHLSLILLVIVSGCATVKTNKAEEMRNVNIKPITTMLWENTVKDMQDKEKHIQEEKIKIEKKKKLEEKKRLERLKPTPVVSKIKEDVGYDVYVLTAYTAYEESTGKTESHPAFGVTASGKTVKEGRTIACPRELDFGTKVYIPYFDNTYTCEDRGSAIRGKKIDVYMKTTKAALNFGRRKLPIKIINT